MVFNVEACIECSLCEKGKASADYTEGYAPEDFEDFKPQEFEDAAIDYFKNHGWIHTQKGDWVCPMH